jgi:general secretion pathway protein D
MKVSKYLLCCLLILLFSFSPFSLPAEKRIADRDSKLAFNFVDVEIPAVIKFISELTGYNFIFDERVKGKITIIAPTRLSIDESFRLFTSVLSLKGFTIIPAGPSTYKILPSSLAKQQGTISTADTIPVNEGYITKLIPTEHINVSEALQFLRPVISRDGHISAFGPRNLILLVDSAVNVEKIMSIIKLIDQQAVKEERAKTHVYFLEHADATILAQVMQGIIKDIQSSYRTTGVSKKPGAGSVPILSITPDKSTNSLIIVAPSESYENILQVIRTLDRKRKQVFVEAMIIEASIDKLQEVGSKWRAALTHKDEPILVGGVGNISSGAIQSIITGLTGLSAGGMGNFLNIPVSSVSDTGSVTSQTLTAPGFAALFSLSDFRDAINVLSTPQILTSDNEEAEIVVGENVPFISTRERDITTSNTVLNSIERTNVGITLRLTPQITEGDYVKLNIFQEISAVKESTESVLTSVGPTTTVRSTKTSVVVKDGQTVVIGGLMEETEEEGLEKTPILGDIPVLGWLFKFKTTSKSKKNLLVFLSPHVVKESETLAEMTEKKHKNFITKEKFYTPGELLVKFKEDVSKGMIAQILEQKKATVINYFEDINTYHITIRKEQTVEDAVNEFSNLPEVLYAEPNYKMQLQKKQGASTQSGLLKEKSGPTGSSYQQGLSSVKEAEQQIRPGLIATAPVTSEIVAPDEIESPYMQKENAVNKEPHSTFFFTEREKKAEQQMSSGIIATAPAARETTTRHVIESPVLQKENATAKEPPIIYVPIEEEIEEEVSMTTSEPATEIIAEEKRSKTIIIETGDAIVYESELNADSDISEIGEYYVQVGSWKHRNYAEKFWEKLIIHYPDAYIFEDGSFHKVRIPRIMTQKHGSEIIKKIKDKFNLDPLLVLNSK